MQQQRSGPVASVSHLAASRRELAVVPGQIDTSIRRHGAVVEEILRTGRRRFRPRRPFSLACGRASRHGRLSGRRRSLLQAPASSNPRGRPVMQKREILVGERYRDRERGQFARPALDWIVEAIYTGTDGIGHAKLVCAVDPVKRKTLSVSILLDPKRFVRADA
jgi:hypothetical protein